jgi:hypothetical protein
MFILNVANCACFSLFIYIYLTAEDIVMKQGGLGFHGRYYPIILYAKELFLLENVAHYHYRIWLPFQTN